MSFRKSDFFVQFRAFYIKEFARQKKVTNKLFKSVRCVVIAKRERAVGEMGFGWLCDDVVVYVYRRIYFCFLIY